MRRSTRSAAAVLCTVGTCAGLTVASLATGAPARAAATAPSSAASSLAADTDRLRSGSGLGGYRVCADLSSIAAAWAAHEAATTTLAHNPDLASQMGGWRSLGENVGYGASEPGVESELEQSPPHRANLLSSSFTEAGFGSAVSSDGRLWVDEVFRQPSGSGCAGGGAASPGGGPSSGSGGSAGAGSAGASAAASRSMQRTAVTPDSTAASQAAAQAAAALAAAQASAARLTVTAQRMARLEVTPVGPRDPVGAALAFVRALTVR